MAISLISMMSADGPAVYYSDALRVTIESHLGYLRTHPNTVYRQIDKQLAYKHEYDMYGLLTALGYPRHLHHVIMRINDLDSPMAYKSSMLYLLVPDTQVVDAIVNLYRTMRRIA